MSRWGWLNALRRHELRAAALKFLVGFLALVQGLILPVGVLALPTGFTVEEGTASSEQVDPQREHVHIESDQAILQYNQFNLAPQETIVFHLHQPTDTSRVLTRVTGGDPSDIAGTLTSNVPFFHVNPSGIQIADTARIQAPTFVASTLDISNLDFAQGSYRFSQPDGFFPAELVNRGSIEAVGPGGLIALLGGAVVNKGLLVAQQGTVALGSGEQMTLTLDPTEQIAVTVDKPLSQIVMDLEGRPVSAAVQQAGTISAPGGNVLIKAESLENLFDRVVNNSGLVEASRLENQGGRIAFVGEGGTLEQGGMIHADGTSNSPDAGQISLKGTRIVQMGTVTANAGPGGQAGQIEIVGVDETLLAGHSQTEATGRFAGGKGGTIHLLAQKVGLLENALVDVSGDVGGGTVLMGGDFQGKGTVPNAWRTYASPDAAIRADSLNQGNGGRVIVWADDANRFYGSITAQGGLFSGDGGFAEVSGKEELDFNGNVNLLAPQGAVGTLLLDPKFLMVRTAGGSAYNSGVNNLFGNNPAGTNVITPASIAAAAANILLQANTDVTVTDPINMISAGKTLTIQAGRSVLINNNITTNNGAISLTANDSAAQSANRTAGAANMTMAVGTTLNAGNQDITLTMGTLNTAGTITVRSLTTTGNVTITGRNGGITQPSGTISANTLTAKTLINGGAAITLNSATNDATTVDLRSRDTADSANAAGAIAYRDANGFDAAAANTTGTVTLTAGGVITQSGAITGSTLTVKTLNNSGAAVTLDNASNDFTTVNLSTRNAADNANVGGALVYRDTNGFRVSGVRTTGTVTLTGGGAITQIGAMTGTTLTAKTLNNAGSAITLNNAGNDFTTVDLRARNGADTSNAAGALSYRDANGFDAAAANTTGTVTLTGGGAITQSGAMAGSTLAVKTLNNSGAAVTLDNASNDFTTVNLSARNAADSANAAGALTYRDANGFAVGQVRTTSTVSLTSGGAITDGNGAAANVTGSTLTLSAVTGINLDTVVSDVIAAVSGTGGIALREADAITLTDLSTTDGSIAVAAGTDIAAASIVVNGTGKSATLQAGRHITVSGPITTAGGGLYLEADSPHSTSGAADGTGTLTVDSAVASNGGEVTLMGANFALNADVDAGSGAIHLARSQHASLTIGSTGLLIQSEMDRLQTTGTLTLGEALTRGTNGSGAGALTRRASSITVQGASDVTIGAASGSGVELFANNGITLNRSLTTNQMAVIDTDRNFGDNSGTLTVANGRTLSTSNNPLTLTVNNFDLAASGSITSGTAALILNDSDGTGIGLGGTAVTNGVNVSGAELQRITSNGLTLQTAGNVIVNGITAANSGNVGTVTLSATGAAKTVSFATGDSTFKGLVANGADGITVDRNLTVTTGGFTANADSNTDGVGTFTVAAARTINALGQPAQITADDIALNGFINSGSGSVTLLPSTGVTVGLGAGAGHFNLTDGELDQVTTTGVLTIGNSTAGAMAVDGLTQGSKNLTLVPGGDITVGTVSTTGAVVLTAGGSILDGNGSALNLTAGGNSSLTAGGVIGLLADPFDVLVTGASLGVSAASEVSGVSVDISGTVTPSGTLSLLNSPPGQVIFNGAVIYSPPPPPPAPLPTAGPLVVTSNTGVFLDFLSQYLSFVFSPENRRRARTLAS
ncbi:MAG: filamentous hemagglutinin N-terminal domain-containing protein [Candidatus Omnitrophica bacterium]|nr:filamentous hemagglutinin N-terminal domain-containing protein [Candidatus Omnitrophota bacterium]